MKLTPELLAQAPSALNPIKERELDLRGEDLPSMRRVCIDILLSGYKIPAIENLGVTRVRVSLEILDTFRTETHI